MSLDYLAGFNIWAVLVSGVVSLIIGFVWYGPLFGKTWGRYTGWTEEKIKTVSGGQMARTYGLTFLAALVSAAALTIVSRWLGASGIGDGLLLGFVTGIGFTGMAFATTHLFEHKPVGLWLIVSGYQLVYLTAAAVIVTIWK
jgi:hypothetical protein